MFDGELYAIVTAQRHAAARNRKQRLLRRPDVPGIDPQAVGYRPPDDPPLFVRSWFAQCVSGIDRDALPTVGHQPDLSFGFPDRTPVLGQGCFGSSSMFSVDCHNEQ